MRIFHRLVQSKGIVALLFIVDLYFWFLIGLPLPVTILLLALSLPILWFCWRVFSGNIAAINVKHTIAFAGLGLLFCLMLPAQMLTDADRLVQAFAVFNPSGQIKDLANLIENVSVIGLAVLFIFLLISVLWIKTCPLHPVEQPEPRSPAWKGFRILFYAVPCLLVWSAFLYVYWPGILTADSFTQWSEIQNVHFLNDWNPVGHTLLEFLLTRIWYSPAIISIFQIVSLAVAWGWVMSFFEGRGFSRRALFISSIGFALLPFNGILLVTLWKDIPYTIANFVLAFMLGLIWYTGGEWLKQWKNCAWLGIILACVYLFRHNGLLLLVIIPPALLLFYFQKWRQVLLAGLVAFTLVFGVRNIIAFGILKAAPNSNAVLYVVPIQHISAVVYYGGQFTDEQITVLEKLAPMRVWKEEYNPYMADTMTKPWGSMEDEDVLNKIDRNKNDLMRVFFALTQKYPGIVLRSELDLMGLQWRIIPPGGSYRQWTLDFYVVSGKLLDWIFHPEIFAHPQRNTPLKAAFDKVLIFINSNPLTYPIFWRGGLYLFLACVFTTLLVFARGWRSILIALPVILNSLSLALSMPVHNFRYIYPNVLITFLLILFYFSRPEAPRHRNHGAAGTL